MTGRQRVSEIILERLPITLIINVISFALMYAVAIPVGVAGAARQFTLTDRILTIVVFLLYSLPGFWIGTIFIAFCTGRLFPTNGYFPGTLSEYGLLPWLKEWTRHLFLPIVCTTYATF